jgi:SAM-dependent methyltransferase
MDAGLRAICPKQTPCKCCHAPALPYGVVDFHKNCESRRRQVLGISGVPIYYHRCPVCQFIFTTAFDHFTNEDFLQHIYNPEYLLVDPEYQEARPRRDAAFLCRLFSDIKPRRILDYGGGHGLLAELLRVEGFSQAETYDPFVPYYAARPRGRFDCVVCFEVVEHSTNPARIFAELSDLVTDPGLILVSTLLQPAEIDQLGLNWWYAAPRNGHVSLYSRTSLEKLVHPLGFQLGSFNDSLHVLIRELPDFARHFLRH